MQAVRAKNSVIVEAETGRRTDRLLDVEAMILDAADELARDGRALTRRQAKRFGAMGGKANAERLAAEVANKRMPRAEAMRWWRDGGLTNTEALHHMKGWTQSLAYRLLGKRGRAAGRPRDTE
jgi:hypothetical protein